jgi:lysophospholipid acyltransferase (LPLAT)-like uncharacterized protein
VDRQTLVQSLEEGPAIIAIFHGDQAPLLHAHGRLGIVGMASQSRDGELLAQLIRRLGYGVIRGSTSRGGMGALRAALRCVEDGQSPALAVDGPRGPARVPQLGALHLAARTQCPVVYMVAHASWALRLRSWDRFVVPLPGAAVTIGYGRMDPPSTDRASVEAAAEELRERMEDLAARLTGRPLSQLDGPASVA